MKGISPLIATVLLIAFTVGVGGLISVWITGFTQTSSKIVSREGENQLICSNGAIELSNMKYCNNNVSGIVKNNGRILIGNITLQTVFNNASLVTHALNNTDTGGSSSGSPLSLKSGAIFSFNVSIGASSSNNYDRFWLYTNCSTVSDFALSSDVTAC